MGKDNYKSYIGIAVVLVIGALLAISGSSASVSAFGFPLFALAIIAAFAIQWIIFIPSYIYRTEKYFDLTGSLTYISIVILALLLSTKTDLRSYLLTTLIIIWALRLGSFLYLRIRNAGEDRRFREIKTSFSRFLLTWTLQGLWVSFSLATGLAAIASEQAIGIDVFLIVGAIIWALGFSIETLADDQKRRFKADPKNKNKFISNGLWAWSRHPNYFGEIVLWIGIAIIAFPVLTGWQYVTLVSPVFVILLLTKISGIPMLEKRADKKWGGQADYEEYKANTPVLIPLPSKGK